MKPLLAFLLLSLPCLAQQRTAPVGVGGFGNVLHPGTGGPAPATFGAGVYRTVRRQPTFAGGNRAVGYPLYVGGSYVPAYGSSYAPDYSSQTQLSPQQQYAPAAPPVVINQYFGPPAPPEPVTSFYQPYAQRPQNDGDDAPDKISQRTKSTSPSRKSYRSNSSRADHSICSKT